MAKSDGRARPRRPAGKKGGAAAANRSPRGKRTTRKRTTRKRPARKRNARRPWPALLAMLAVAVALVWLVLEIARRDTESSFRLPPPSGAASTPEITDAERLRLRELLDSIEDAKE